jgi:large subunit ribosomal protein L25
MEQRELKVEVRSKTGKGISRQLRSSGLIPGVVYGKGMESTPVSVNPKELKEAIAGEGGHNNLITLKGGGSLDGNTVIVADILRSALRNEMQHVDLHKINLTEKVKVEVKVRLVGTAAGVKDGGLLDFAMHKIEVECLPTQIPEHIDLDVTALTIGHSLHVADLQMPAGVKVLEDPKASVVSILGKTKEEGAAAPAAE